MSPLEGAGTRARNVISTWQQLDLLQKTKEREKGRKRCQDTGCVLSEKKKGTLNEQRSQPTTGLPTQARAGQMGHGLSNNSTAFFFSFLQPHQKKGVRNVQCKGPKGGTRR